MHPATEKSFAGPVLQETLALLYILQNLALLCVKMAKILSKISAVKSSQSGV